MRWSKREHPSARIKTIFPLLAITISGEMVWLEKVRVLQEYRSYGPWFYYWEDMRFLGKDEKLDMPL
jgi:hypothetical protein